MTTFSLVRIDIPEPDTANHIRSAVVTAAVCPRNLGRKIKNKDLSVQLIFGPSFDATTFPGLLYLVVDHNDAGVGPGLTGKRRRHLLRVQLLRLDL